MKKIKNLIPVLLIAFVLCLPILSLAQGTKPVGSSGIGTKPVSSTGNSATTIVNPLASKGIDNINTLVKTVLEGVIRIGIPIIALAIIYSGFLFVAARGNSEKLGKAKDSLIYTLIGAAILLGAWTIAQLISETVLQIK